MPRPARTRRRSVAAGLALLIVAPLLASLHHHEVDHDGATRHIERAHGGHMPVLAETQDKVAAGGVNIPLAPPLRPAPGLDARIGARVARVLLTAADPPPRPPRTPPPSRAPPALG